MATFRMTVNPARSSGDFIPVRSSIATFLISREAPFPDAVRPPFSGAVWIVSSLISLLLGLPFRRAARLSAAERGSGGALEVAERGGAGRAVRGVTGEDGRDRRLLGLRTVSRAPAPGRLRGRHLGHESLERRDHARIE